MIALLVAVCVTATGACSDPQPIVLERQISMGECLTGSVGEAAVADWRGRHPKTETELARIFVARVRYSSSGMRTDGGIG